MMWALVAVLQSTPAIVEPGVISSPDPEFAASLAPDGTSFFFNRASAHRTRIEILVSHFREGVWGAPETVPFSACHQTLDSGGLWRRQQRPLPGLEVSHPEATVRCLSPDGQCFSRARGSTLSRASSRRSPSSGLPSFCSRRRGSGRADAFS